MDPGKFAIDESAVAISRQDCGDALRIKVGITELKNLESVHSTEMKIRHKRNSLYGD